MRTLLTVVAFGLVLLAGEAFGLDTEPPRVRVLKISCGPSGQEANGNFVLSPERSIFNRTDDHNVIVLFEWEGTAGGHRLVAQWRSPDSALTSTSAIDYIAKAERFGAYWKLPLSASMALGTWSIEATVDGVPAGRFTFELTDENVESSPRKPILAEADLYDRLNRAFVVLQRFLNDGRELPATAGFSPAPGLIYTAMSTIDNADEIRAVGRDGAATPVLSAVAWSRTQHWAVLSGTVDAEALPVAAIDATKVGSRCFALQNSGGGRVISPCTISGSNATGASPVLTATFLVGSGAPGAPVLNEFGELIGLVSDVGRTGERDVAVSAASTLATAVIPLHLINVIPTAPTVALSDLRSREITVRGVVGDQHVLTGGIGRVDAKGKLEAPEHHSQLSIREKAFAVFVTWTPRERLRGEIVVRVYNGENGVVAESKPAKADFRKSETSRSAWSFPMPSSPGTYRADVLLDGKTMWRGYVRITG